MNALQPEIPRRDPDNDTVDGTYPAPVDIYINLHLPAPYLEASSQLLIYQLTIEPWFQTYIYI